MCFKYNVGTTYLWKYGSAVGSGFIHSFWVLHFLNTLAINKVVGTIILVGFSSKRATKDWISMKPQDLSLGGNAISETLFNVSQFSELDTISLSSLKRERFLDMPFLIIPLRKKEKNFTIGVLMISNFSCNFGNFFSRRKSQVTD